MIVADEILVTFLGEAASNKVFDILNTEKTDGAENFEDHPENEEEKSAEKNPENRVDPEDVEIYHVEAYIIKKKEENVENQVDPEDIENRYKYKYHMEPYIINNKEENVDKDKSELNSEAKDLKDEKYDFESLG